MLKQSGRLFPLVLFLCVGAVLFALENWRSSQAPKVNRIQISADHIDRLKSSLQLRYGQPPSQDQLDAELQAYIDEELLYREALRLGLHMSDEIVRRRLAQTMAFIIEGTAELESPSDTELRAWFERERREPVAVTRIDFQHVFFSSKRSEEQVVLDVSEVLNELNSGTARAADEGDPFLQGSKFQGYSPARIAKDFGDEFAATIAEAEPGKWSGPFVSVYGRHLVLVENREQAAGPDFEQQRTRLINAWRSNRRREVREEALELLRLEFDIEVEEQRLLRDGRQ